MDINKQARALAKRIATVLWGGCYHVIGADGDVLCHVANPPERAFTPVMRHPLSVNCKACRRELEYYVDDVASRHEFPTDTSSLLVLSDKLLEQGDMETAERLRQIAAMRGTRTTSDYL
jgi:hypothetical protein